MAFRTPSLNFVTSPSGLLVPDIVEDTGNERADITFDIQPSTADGWVLTTDAGEVVWAPPQAGDDGGIPETILNAKGDLISATAADTAAILTVGNDGEILTADSGESTGLKWALAADAAWDAVITKTGDESIASSTAVQNDDELFFTTSSGSVYELEVYIVFGSPAGGGTPDIKLDFGESAGAIGMLTAAGLGATDVSSLVTVRTNQTDTAIWGTNANNRLGTAIGMATGAGGTWRVRWAQNTSSINATIVRAGSFIRYRVIA